MTAVAAETSGTATAAAAVLMCAPAHIINPINDRCRANFNIYTECVRVGACVPDG
jgi:hypothetical protein